MILEGFRTEIPPSLSLTPHDCESRAGGSDEDKPTRYAVRGAVNEPSSASGGPRRDPLGISDWRTLHTGSLSYESGPRSLRCWFKKTVATKTPTLQVGLLE